MLGVTTNISDIVGDRMDVSFRMGIKQILHSVGNISYKSLGEIANFSCENWDQKSVFDDTFPYIEIGSIDTTTGVINDINHIPVKEAPSRAKRIVRKNDILISTTRPNRGAICLYEADTISIASTGFSIIREIDSSVLRDYLFIVLRLPFSLEQMIRRSSGGNYPAIIESELMKILIPIPSMKEQQKVVDIYIQAQVERTRRHQTAKQQLESIDDYLLDVLHVDKNQATICSNGYAKNISTILGNRLDVSFYKNRFELISKKYSNVPLSSVAHIDPSINFSGYDANTPISFIPMECVDEIYGEIHVIKSTTILQSKGYTKFEEGDLLWAKITPCMQNGKSAIVKNLENGIGCGSTEFFVLRPRNNNVLIDYIYLLLRHHEVLKAAQSSFGGSAGQQRVSSQYLKSIIIPIPDYSIQKDIVAKIYNMKSQAKQLQKEGDKLLEEAKQKIEKLIFE